MKEKYINLFTDSDSRKASSDASIARFQPEERQAYESSLKYYRDLKNVIDTARDEGREEGREQGREEGLEQGREEATLQIVQDMLTAGLPDQQICSIARISSEQLQIIKNNL